MICENCGKEHDGKFGSGRFCSKSCANTRHHSNETKEKISSILKIKYPKKGKICHICGSKFYNYKHKICDSEFCKTHSKHIDTLIKYFGFDSSKLGTLEVINEFNRIKNILYNLYWIEHKSSSEICKIFNYPNVGNLTAKVFNYLGIKSKTCKIANKENYLQDRQNVRISQCYKQQWHTTWNNKEVYLHSSYELDYANELDKQKIDYDVECLRIKYWDTQRNEYRCAIPDFYIPSENLIVEIKSDYTLDIQNMIDKKNEYLKLGYKFKLICEHKEKEI